VKLRKTARQSWHGNDAQVKTKGDRKKAKTKQDAPRTPSYMLKPSTSKSSVKSKASVQRADSLTLGVLIPKVPAPEMVTGSESLPADQNRMPAQHALLSSFEEEIPEFI
jgi:hypothetical protein